MATVGPGVQPKCRKLLQALILVEEVHKHTDHETDRSRLMSAKISIQHVIAALEGNRQ